MISDAISRPQSPALNRPWCAQPARPQSGGIHACSGQPSTASIFFHALLLLLLLLPLRRAPRMSSSVRHAFPLPSSGAGGGRAQKQQNPILSTRAQRESDGTSPPDGALVRNCFLLRFCQHSPRPSANLASSAMHPDASVTRASRDRSFFFFFFWACCGSGVAWLSRATTPRAARDCGWVAFVLLPVDLHCGRFCQTA